MANISERPDRIENMTEFWRRRRYQIELEMRECLETDDAERGKALVEAAWEIDERIATAERGF